MKVLLTDITQTIPGLQWSAEELAEKLSLIGHETEVVGESINVTLTANRQDCRELAYLIFDLIAIYPELGNNDALVTYQPGNTVKVTRQQIDGILGAVITKEQYQQLERLGFTVQENAVIAPDFRVDIFEPADVAEEIFRLHGMAIIKVIMLSKEEANKSPEYQCQQNLRAALVEAGINETRTVSFAGDGTTALKNPFSGGLPYLRPNLLDGLLQTLAKNPYLRRIAFFEIGNVFNPDEQTNVGVVFSGHKNKETAEETLKKVLGTNIELTAPAPELLHRYNVKQPNIWYGEMATNIVKVADGVNVKTTLPNFQTVSKFPPLVRDVSITSPTSDDFNKNIYQQFPELLFVEQVDTYTDPKTKRTTKTYRLIFQKNTASFTQEEISEIDQRIDRRFFQAA